MAKYQRIVTTKAGLELLESVALGGTIQFTSLKTGTGTYDGTEDLAAMASIKNVRQTFSIGSVTKEDSDILVRIILCNNDVTEGYAITELGLYAKNPTTGAEVLFAITIAASGCEDYMPVYTDEPTSIVVDFVIGITDAEKVTFAAAPMKDTYVQLTTFNEFAETINSEMAVERSRINNLIALEEGSEVTDVEKEMADIKVDVDGTIHKTAGEAVRAQIKAVNTEVASVKSDLSKVEADVTNGLADLDTSRNAIYKNCFEFEQVSKNGTEIIIDRDMFDVKYDKTPTVLLPNRFDYKSIPLEVSTYNAYHTLTHENNGLKIVKKALSSAVYSYCTAQYVCEFSGTLWFSCDAKADNVMDLMIKIKLNDTVLESIYGNGRLYCSVPVTKGDTLSMLFYGCIGNTEANTIEYSNVMLQYGELTDFTAFGYTGIIKTVQLPTDNNKLYKTETTNVDSTYYRVTIPISSIVDDFDSAFLPTKNNIVADGIEVIGLPKVSYNDTYNGINGVGMDYNGNLSIQVDGKGRDSVVAYLKENPVSIIYHSTEVDTTNLKASSIVTSDTNISVLAFSSKVEQKTKTHVAMGDSITGMFGYGTSYPEMITRMSTNIKSINVGFSGSQVTDHSNANYKAFSFNRLVDAIISKDWTLQDNAVVNLDTAYYAEHLTALKGINFNEVDYLTLFYGTNDWGSSVLLETMETVYVESITKLLTAFPHLKIVVISPYWRAISSGKDSNVDANSNNEYLYDFADAIEELAKKNFNCPTINYYRTLGANAITNRYFTQDGTHPTFSTREKIAKDLINLLN